MRKNIKKTIFLLLVAFMVIAVPLSVLAESVQTGTVAGKSVRGTVSINGSGASATTSISVAPNSGSSATVSLSYSYIDTRTNANQVTTVTAGANGNIAASASRTKPNKDYYRSWRAKGTHKVTYSGQTWNANTEVFY